MIDRREQRVGNNRRIRASAAFVEPLGMTTRRYRRKRASMYTYQPILEPGSKEVDKLVTEQEFELSQRVYSSRDNRRGISLDTLREWKVRGLRQFPDGLWGWETN